MRVGLHAPTQGATERFTQAASLLGAAFVWQPRAEEPRNALDHPDALHVLRIANWAAGEEARAYLGRVRRDIASWRGVPNLVVQCGNEPDREAGHDGERFPEMAAAVRAAFPGIALANPPLSVEATNRLTAAVVAAADYVACHCYWETFAPQDIANEGLGASYRIALRAAGGKPVVVTEVNANPEREGPEIDWTRRNDQVATWLRQADADGVHAAMLFIADAAPDWARYDVGPEAAAAIRAAYETPVVPPGVLPAPTTVGLPTAPFTREDYRFRALSWEQYQAIIQRGSM